MHAFRGHRERHIVDGLPFRAGGFRHRGDFRVDPLFDAHLREGHRQADALAEAQHGFNLVHRAVLQHQLRQGAEGTFSP